MQDKNFTIKPKTNTNFSINVQCICDFVKENTFIDYLRGGLQLALSIGIDFTGSKGIPKIRSLFTILMGILLILTKEPFDHAGT